MNATVNPLRKVLYYFLYPACAYFSVSAFIIAVVAAAAANPSWAPTVTAMLYIWVFSMAAAALGNIFRAEKINLFLKFIFHYLGLVVSFILIFLVAVGNYDNSAGALIIIVVFTIIYILVASVATLLRGAIKKSEKKDERYKRQFGG